MGLIIWALKVNKKLGKGLASAIEKGESTTKATKETVSEYSKDVTIHRAAVDAVTVSFSNWDGERENKRRS